MEKWVYSWNPRDQMTNAEKFTGAGDAYAGKVEYFYCLSCDGALSQRKEYDSGSTTVPISWKRFEYDGLNLLRVDERYDDETSPPDGIDSGDPWRTLEVATHKPGALGAMLGKRVYTHSDNNATPDATTDYGYVYDSVGNVISAFLDDDDEGEEAFYFVQDAFGNEVSVSPFTGDSWSTARTAGVTEHQTGKWIDGFTGLYFFHARWYESGVGRFVGRDKSRAFLPWTKRKHQFASSNTYEYCESIPTGKVDIDGNLVIADDAAILLAIAGVSAAYSIAALACTPENLKALDEAVAELEETLEQGLDQVSDWVKTSANWWINAARRVRELCWPCPRNHCLPCEITEGPLPLPQFHFAPGQHGCGPHEGHWHYFRYNQNPVTCKCNRQRMFGGCFPLVPTSPIADPPEE